MLSLSGLVDGSKPYQVNQDTFNVNSDTLIYRRSPVVCSHDSLQGAWLA